MPVVMIMAADCQAFEGKKNHAYAKLLPEGVGNGELMAEGEGALSLGAGDKRCGPPEKSISVKMSCALEKSRVGGSVALTLALTLAPATKAFEQPYGIKTWKPWKKHGVGYRIRQT